MSTEVMARESYIGEKRRFLRNGHGVYHYENKFFKYEGEWKDGVKHGHGKLTLKDGTYYEGQFAKGEISGLGFKYFAISRCSFTGQFVNGELHGHGRMEYSDRSTYEGEWQRNRRHGFGTFTSLSGLTYHGEFNCHYKHGQGVQVYENGDRYDGHWMKGDRHGHGEWRSADGTEYSGQFAHNVFHGDGKMNHPSGMIYDGLWVHGFPSQLASKLALVEVESPLVVFQGQPFNIAVTCVDAEGNKVIQDQGRELKISAGFKYVQPTSGSALLDMIEDMEDELMETPFGYQVLSYPLLHTHLQAGRKEEEADTGGMNSVPDSIESSVESSTSRESRATMQVASCRTDHGYAEWTSLQLAPPPSLYRHFVAMDEEKRRKKPADGGGAVPDSRERSAGVDGDKFAPIGNYVLVIHDISMPEFFGSTLDTVCLKLTVKQPKKLPAVKKSK